MQRDEDFITQFIFVPLFNRSKAFRNFLEEKSGIVLCEKIEFSGETLVTGSCGRPDAYSDDNKLFIDVKTKLTSKLTDFEKDSGACYIKVKDHFVPENKCNSMELRGNINSASYEYWGYRKFLDYSYENRLLYVVCNDAYDMRECCKNKKGKGSVGIVYWTDILNFIKDQNKEDPFVEYIENSVEGLDGREEDRISETEITDKLCRLSASLGILGIIGSGNAINSDETNYICKSGIIWLCFNGLPEFFIGVSVKTGEIYLYAIGNAYEKFKKNPPRFKGFKTWTEFDNEVAQELYERIRNLSDFNYEDFEINGIFVTELIKYLDELKKIV